MAVRLKLNTITDDQKKIIRKLLYMQPKESGYFSKQKYFKAKDPILVYYIDKPFGEIVLPYLFGNKLIGTHINATKNYPPGKYNFINTTLRQHQIPIVNEAITHLNTIGTTTLGAPPGSGKTLMSAYLASQYGGLVLVLSPLKLVQRGWMSTFEKYTDATIWHNDGKQQFPKSCNVILTMNTMFQKIPKQILSMVQTLIIDEAHMFCTPDRIHCLLGTTPRYIIACTATPNRTDEMQSIMHAVCGTHGIFIKPTKEYTVYKLSTGIETVIDKTRTGGSNWPKLIKDLAIDPKRNAMILDIVLRNPTFKIMILTWNRDHAYFLTNLFKDNGVKADVLAGTKSSYSDSRVLVCTFGKAGVGFDEAVVATDWDGMRLNMMFLVGSTKNVNSLCQFVGRIFRSDHPIIIDFVDNNSICKRHWNARRKWYSDPDQNGTIIEIDYIKDDKTDDTINTEKIALMQSQMLKRIQNKIKNKIKNK